MKKLIIAGAGGFGREVLNYALDVQEKSDEWKVYGFINDIKEALDGYNVGYPIIGTIKEHIPQEDEVFICAIGDSETRLRICRDLKSKGAKFISLIHPTAFIGHRSTWGDGLIMAPKTHVATDVKLGSFITMNGCSGIGHDVVAEDGCTLSSFCDVTGFCHLEEGVYMGSHACLKPNTRVGKYSKIGMGAVVIKNVPANVVMFGNPAKQVY